jgi:Rrf2 family transcriptional regulator, cysteine metabolism repressor
MKVSTKGRYALRAMSHLARSYYTDNNRSISIKEIAARESISNRYLENIFIKLKKAGILDSTKGEKGGFKMKRDPEEVTLLDILTVVENEVAPSQCVVKMNVCGNSPKCGIRKIWGRLHQHVNTFLKGVTLKEIMQSHLNKG